MVCSGTICYYYLIATVAVGISVLPLSALPTNGATGTIQATATVIQPVGIVPATDSAHSESYLLYCPRRGHVSCAVVFLDHQAQLARNGALEVRSPIATQTFAGLTASVLETERLLAGCTESDRTCVITLTYTEN